MRRRRVPAERIAGVGVDELPRPTPGLAVVDSGDRVVVLDPCRPERPPVILEGFAAEVWRRLTSDPDARALCAAATDGGLSVDHVTTFLASLADADLVQVR